MHTILHMSIEDKFGELNLRTNKKKGILYLSFLFYYSISQFDSGFISNLAFS